MKNTMKFLSALLVLALSGALFAQEAAPAPKAPTVLVREDGSRLVAWITPSEAFAQAVDRRKAAADAYAADLKAQQEAPEAEKSSFDEKLAAEQNTLIQYNLYLNIVFAPEMASEYAFDIESKVVFLRIGTSQEIFLKALARRGLLEKAIAEATDEEAKTRLTANYQLLQRALEFVYGIRPDQEYTYNAEKDVIYLNTTEEGAAQILQNFQQAR